MREIAQLYDPILDNSEELTQSDRELLKLAQEFDTALQKNDDHAIVAVNEKIKSSAFRKLIALTQGERERIEQAENRIQAITITGSDRC